MMRPEEVCGSRWTNTRSGRVVHHWCDQPLGHEPPHVCGMRRGLKGNAPVCKVQWLVRGDASVQCLTLAPWQKRRDVSVE